MVGNEILCASNDGEFYRFGWTPGDIESPRFRDSFVHGFGDTMSDKSATKVIGMNSRGHLVAIVLANGFVEIRERSGWTVRQRFAAPGAHDAAWSTDHRPGYCDEKGGRVWFTTAEDGAVRREGLNGKVVATLRANVPNAGAFALDHTGAVWVTREM